MKPDASDGRRTAENPAGSRESPPAVEPLGAALKAARSDRGLSLRQVSDETHISLRHLQNLEEGRYADLPGGMYNRAFLRSYCRFLELDPQRFLDRLDRESEPPAEKAPKAKPLSSPIPVESFRPHPLLVWGVMLVASVIGLYLSRGWIADLFSPYFSSRPVPPAPSAGTLRPAAVSAKVESLRTAEDRLPASAPGSTAPAAAPAGRQQVLEPGTIHLGFNLIEPCWISVVEDGVQTPSRIYQPGEDVTFDARQQFQIVLGNAGGVNLTINGKPAKSLGKSGEVLRLRINAESIPELLAKLN